MAYTYSVIVNGTTFDLKEIVDSRTLKIVKPFCSTKKTSGKGTMTVTLRGAADKLAYQTFMQAFLASQYDKTVNDCTITVSEGGSPVFIGFLDKSCINLISKKIPQDLTLAATDKSSLLDEKIRYNEIYETSGTGHSRNAIIRDLFTKLSADSGITVTLVSTDLSDSDVAAPFAITEDKGETYRDVIDRLLLEAIGYVLVFDPSVNGFRVKRIPTDIVGVTPREVSYLVNDSLQTKSAIYDNDGILLSFPNIVTRPNTNLYAESISLSIDENGNVTGNEVQPGEYYPATSDVKKVYQEFRIADRSYISGESRLANKDLELLFARSVTVGLASNPALSLAPALPNVEWLGTVEYLPTKGRAIYVNSFAKASNVTDFTYTGTATYIDSYNKVTYPKACVKPEEYTAKTIIDADKAKRFACWLYNSKNYGETISQWAEYDSSAYLGEIVNVIHKDTGVQMPHVIVQITDESISGSRVRKSSIVAISIYSWSAYDASDASIVENLESGKTNSEPRIIKTLPQYYHSHSLEMLIPNVFVVTSDTTMEVGKTYYEFSLDTGFVVTTDPSFVVGKTYYEDASWIDEIVDHTGGDYYVNGRLVVTEDVTPQAGKTYYYYDEDDDEYKTLPSGSPFDPNLTYFEFVEYPSYVWHRQKYVYSNGDIAYSSYAYYLTTADVANPFEVKTEYATSTADHFVVTSDATPDPNKVYYTNATGKWTIIEILNNSFPVGMNPSDIYEIENVSAWVEGAIPSSWKSGLDVWLRETVIYENKPDDPIVQIPYYSAFHTRQMEDTCKFEVSLSAYSWNKNRRQASDALPITINVSYNIQGYSTIDSPLHLSLSVSPNTGVTVDPNAQFFSFASDIAQDALVVHVTSTEYPSIVREFTVTCVDITEKATYFGILNADPSFSNTGVYQFIEGDHFVAQGIVGKIDLMPYVYHNGAWTLLSDSIQKYGDVVRENILADSAADIFNNAEWVYTACSAGDTAQVGVDYFELNQDNEYVPVVLQIGDDVSSYYTRQKNIPSVVTSYYHYNAKLIASYISANDIQLTDETAPNTGVTSYGQIRSAGYEKGTVQKIIDTVKSGGSIDRYQKGFFGSSDGHFEAFQAWLYQATIYNANITGELRNDLFLTQLESQSGEDYYLNPLTDESWSGTKALQAIKNALIADNKGEEESGSYNGLYEIVPMSADYPTQNDSYSYGMLVEDVLHEHDSGSILANSSYTMPIRADVDIYKGKFFDTNDAEILTGTDLTRGTVLKNIKRWAIADVYNHSSLSKNTIYSASGSFAGSSFSRLACVSNTGSTALSATSSSRQTTDRNDPGNWSFTAPSSYRNSGTKMSVTVSGETNHGINTVLWTDYRWEGNVRIYVNGSLKASWTGVKGDKLNFNFLYFSWSGTVTMGDVVNVQIDSSGQDRAGWALHNGDVTVTFGAQTFSQIGCTSNGVWKWNGSSWGNLGTNTERFQENDTIHTGQPLSMTSPISWASADHLLPAQLKYNFSKYQVGLNLVSSDGTRQQTIVSGAHPISEYFACVYNSVSVYNSANATHYFHYAGLWKYAKCEVPLTAFEAGKTYYEENGGTYSVTSDATPVSTKQYYLKETVNSGAIYSIDVSSLAYQKYDQARHPASGSFTDTKTIIWQPGQLLIEGATEISIIQSSEWLEMLSFSFRSMASLRGNYADTIVPIEAENVRQHEINLGEEGNAFDNAFVKKIGSKNKPVQTANINQLGTIVPISGAVLSAFDVTLVYYELNNGFYVVTEDVTPNASKTYYVIYPTTDAYVKNLWEVNNQQTKLIRDLYVKISQVEQSLSSSTSMIPSSKAVTDAIMNITVNLDYTDIVSLRSNGQPCFCYYQQGYVHLYISGVTNLSTYTVANGTQIGTHALQFSGVLRGRACSDDSLGRTWVICDHNSNGAILYYPCRTNLGQVSISGFWAYHVDFPVSYLPSNIRAKYGI